MNLYGSRSLPEWIAILDSPAAIEARYVAFAAVASLGKMADVQPWAERLCGDASADLRAAAIRWWAKQAAQSDATDALRSAAVAHLRAAWSDADPDVQVEAVVAFQQLQPAATDHASVVWNLAQRNDAEPLTQARLARLLGRIPSLGNDALFRLTTWLQSEQTDLREAAAAAIAEWLSHAPGQPVPAAVAEALITATDDEEPLVRESAALALGHIRPITPAITAALTVAAEDEDSQVAQAAQEALRLSTKP
jgi:HEAT repeat protein